jgi:hypothetical protein
MAFTDPQSITIDGVTTSLPRVSTGAGNASYSSADRLLTLSASHAYGRRTRRVVRIDHSKITSDPFRPDENRQVGMSAYLVIDLPPVGYTNEEVKDVYVGFNTVYTASTHALIDKLLGGES